MQSNIHVHVVYLAHTCSVSLNGVRKGKAGVIVLLFQRSVSIQNVQTLESCLQVCLYPKFTVCSLFLLLQ